MLVNCKSHYPFPWGVFPGADGSCRATAYVPVCDDSQSSRKEESKPKITEPVIPVKDPVVICPPPKSRKYLPPEDLQSRVEFRVREIFGSTVAKDWQKASLGDSGLKYRLLAQLAVDLGHTVPNSQLHQMKSAGDVVAFYRIPVKDISNFDELSTKELPPNLRINWQY